MSARILIAEDDEVIREGLRKVFEKRSYDVRTAADGQDALSILAFWTPDLLILDYSMPGAEGPDICRHVRSTPGLKTVPVILLTGFVSDEIMGKARDAGADRCLSKPIENAALLGEVETLLRGTGRVREGAA